jgi:hypothetical protein
VYEWPVTGDTITENATIPHDEVFLDAPRGKSFAWVAELPDKGHYKVETVGAPDGEYLFVRAMVDGGILSGWVSRMNVKIGLGAGGTGRLGGSHRTRGPTQNRVQLPRGTLLSLGDEALGVIKADGFYSCIRACTEARPLVSVPACGDIVDLVAQLPEGPT